MYISWKDTDLSQFLEAKQFGPNGALRGSVSGDRPGMVKLVDDFWLRLTVDYALNKKLLDSRVISEPDHRREFTLWPWKIRYQEGSEEIISWVYRFPSTYEKPLTPVSIFQMYCRSASGDWGDVMAQLEISSPSQSGMLHGEVQMIHNSTSGKYRKGTGIVPEAGSRLHVVIKAKHGVNGHLKVVLNGITVYEKYDRMVFPEDPTATAQFKLGIYHHGLKSTYGRANNQLHVSAGHSAFALDMSPVFTVRRHPDDPSFPGWIEKVPEWVNNETVIDDLTGKIGAIKELLSG